VLKTNNNIYKEQETTGRNFPLHERLVKKHDKTKTAFRDAEKARNAKPIATEQHNSWRI
jgi:hypothetical protein